MMKPKLGPPLENKLEVGMDTEGMGVGTLGILKDGDDATTDIPQIEEPN
jgi:hypothetical protein